MGKNSLGKKTTSQSDEKLRRPSDEILEDVLEEIPEMDSVDRSGLLQIILFPLIAIMVIAAIPLLLSFTTFRKSDAPLARYFPYASLESELLKNAVLEIESKRLEVNRKDITIRRYEERIQTMDGNLRIMQELMEESLLLREQALRAEVQTILTEERTRLTALGRTDEEVERALERLQSGLEFDYEDKMEDFKNRELGTYQNRIDSMKSEKNNLLKALETAVEERQALARTLEGAESELLVQIYNQPDYIQTENEGVKAELEILQNTSRTQNYWLDELANQYLGLFNALSIKDSETAKSHLIALESMFSNEIIADLPGIDTRNDADREIVRFMSAYLSAQEGSDMERLLAETRMLIERAESHAEEGRLYEATQSWDRVESLWPLMGQAIAGSRATRDIVTAREVRRYANLADISLSGGDYEGAALVWEAGLERLPDPLGDELESWWTKWNNSEAERRRAENTEEMALILDYEMKLAEETAEKNSLKDQLVRIEIDAGLSASATEVDQDNQADLAAARTRIADLEAQIVLLGKNLTEATAPIESGSTERPVTTQWLVFGTIVQIIGETLVIEPMTTAKPAVGSDLRIRRSLGGDRVIHLADGFLLEANETRAVGRISSSASGAEIYGSPSIDDLVYVAVPVLE